MRWTLPSLILSSCLPLTAAEYDDYDDYKRTADVPEHHLRLTVQSLPKKIKSEVSATGLGSTETTDTADSAGRLSLGYAYTSPKEVGFFFGTGLDFSQIKIDNEGFKTKISQTGIHIEPGLSWRISGGFSLETGLQFGLGAVKTTTDIPDTTFDNTSYFELSPRVRGVYAFSSGLELLAEVGYQYQRFDYDYSATGFKATAKETSTGGFFGLGLGWAF